MSGLMGFTTGIMVPLQRSIIVIGIEGYGNYALGSNLTGSLLSAASGWQGTYTINNTWSAGGGLILGADFDRRTSGFIRLGVEKTHMKFNYNLNVNGNLGNQKFIRHLKGVAPAVGMTYKVNPMVFVGFEGTYVSYGAINLADPTFSMNGQSPSYNFHSQNIRFLAKIIYRLPLN
jgi:hypothetical protein